MRPSIGSICYQALPGKHYSRFTPAAYRLLLLETVMDRYRIEDEESFSDFQYALDDYAPRIANLLAAFAAKPAGCRHAGRADAAFSHYQG